MLIAGEINSNIPDINFSSIELFLKNTEQHHSENITSNVEKIYFKRNNRQYPWHRRVLQYEGKFLYDYTNFLEIQKIIQIANFLPINNQQRTMILLYQTSQINYDFNWHFDGDVNFGFRICFGLNLSVPFVKIAKLKPNFENIKYTGEKIDNSMVYDNNQHDLFPSKKNTILLLNKNKSPHKVPIYYKNNSKRCVVLVHGCLNHLNLEFIQKIEDEFHA